MNWILLGAAATAIVKDPQAGERMLEVLIYAVCYLVPLMPGIFVGAEKRAYEAVKHQLWARISITTSALAGLIGLVAVGMLFPFAQVSSPALLVAMVSLLWGLLTIRRAKKGWPPKYNLEDLTSRITPENKHNFSETDFGDPVGQEKL